MVFWTFTVERRRTGWLDPEYQSQWEKICLHAAFRFSICFPVYVLMPDHLHFLCCGLEEGSDQKKATSFLRTYGRPGDYSWQKQPHDHVLREKERERGAFVSTARYILENPVRANLVKRPEDWRFSGCVVPGYPRLSPFDEKYWDRFWKIYGELTGVEKSAE